ncbi:MFS transporter [Streptomyces sp. URMC 123]|uniref:MFS transporter n=1 Tax=Streptomyces sp. URMC 123 TaxID=3423403 RepID=UPI003F1B68DF
MPESPGSTSPAAVAPPPGSDERPAAAPKRVPGLWLALLGAPVSLGTTTPALILPHAAGSLGVSMETAIWIVTTYAWGIAVGTPLMAGVLRRYGFRTTLLASSALALAGTVLVIASPWLGLLLPGRAAQAIGAAGLTTTAMNLAGSSRRMGLITAGIGLCAALGPLAGSLLGDGSFTWRPAIALSLISILAVPVALRRAPAAVPGRADRHFDAVGAVKLTALATALVFIPHYPLPAVLAALAAGALLVAHLRTRPDGFVPVAVLRAPAFLPACALAFALATSYFALLYGVPRLLDHRVHWTTGQIGPAQLVALAIGAALALTFASLAGRMSRLALSLVLVVLGALALGTTVVAHSPWPLLAALAIALLTASGGQATLAVVANREVPESQRPSGIGLFNLCYQLGGAFGPAIVALLAI